MKIKITYIPFCPNIRINEESVDKELFEQIKKAAEFYNKPIDKFSAVFKLEWCTDRWLFQSEIIYDGDLSQKSIKSKLKKS